MTLVRIYQNILKESATKKVELFHGTKHNTLTLDKNSYNYYGIFTHPDPRVALDYTGIGHDGYVFILGIKPDANILNLKDPYIYFEWCLENGVLDGYREDVASDDYDDRYWYQIGEEIVDDDGDIYYPCIPVELYDSLHGGTSYQYSRNLQNEISKTAESLGYDILIAPDYLGSSAGEHISYIILDMKCVQTVKRHRGREIEKMYDLHQ